MAMEKNDKVRLIVDRKKAADRADYAKAVAQSWESKQETPDQPSEPIGTWGRFAGALQSNAAAWNNILVDSGFAIHIEERKRIAPEVANLEIKLFQDGRHTHKSLNVHVDALGAVQIQSGNLGVSLPERKFSFRDEAAMHNFDEAIIAFLHSAMPA